MSCRVRFLAGCRICGGVAPRSLQAISARRHAYQLLEGTQEIFLVVVADRIGYLREGVVGQYEPLTGLVDPHLTDQRLEGGPRVLTNQSTKPALGKPRRLRSLCRT